MKKLLISESQLEMLVNHINETNLIKESWDGVLFGAAKLMGVKLSGINANIADNAIHDENTMKRISDTLESSKIDELAQRLEGLGLKNAKEYLENNENEIINTFNTIARKNKFNTLLYSFYGNEPKNGKE